ncbi:MAG: hypothetical protein ACRCYU_18565, partial [Nocardioides sp.]
MTYGTQDTSAAGDLNGQGSTAEIDESDFSFGTYNGVVDGWYNQAEGRPATPEEIQVLGEGHEYDHKPAPPGESAPPPEIEEW